VRRSPVLGKDERPIFLQTKQLAIVFQRKFRRLFFLSWRGKVMSRFDM
jgi:hypothetical protein